MNQSAKKKQERRLKILKNLYRASIAFALVAWLCALFTNDYNFEWFRGFGLGACTMSIFTMLVVNELEKTNISLRDTIKELFIALSDIEKRDTKNLDT